MDIYINGETFIKTFTEQRRTTWNFLTLADGSGNQSKQRIQQDKYLEQWSSELCGPSCTDGCRRNPKVPRCFSSPACPTSGGEFCTSSTTEESSLSAERQQKQMQKLILSGPILEEKAADLSSVRLVPAPLWAGPDMRLRRRSSRRRASAGWATRCSSERRRRTRRTCFPCGRRRRRSCCRVCGARRPRSQITCTEGDTALYY